ncbi:hypothetical protein ACFOVU_12500 [Nocardiopsis sediminis]|uniref:WXG100 family type VII secretion target n=1 Tax=Nocardiopsis sediminis TaxID=1778267 RepID=A0ABV8FKS0_9ACTN
MSSNSIDVKPDPMAIAAANMNEATDLVHKIMGDFNEQVAALRNRAWGEGDKIAEIGGEQFDPGAEQIREGGTALEGALRKTTESTINSSRILGGMEEDNIVISNDLVNGMPGGGSRR